MIKISESFASEIKTSAKSFSKIIFDVSSLKKVEKVYSSFHIPTGESIVAYIKSTVPFMGPAMVITDHTLYSYLHEAFPISEICRYIVSQKDEKAAVILSTGSEVYTFWASTLVAKNVAGTELVQLIGNLQQQLIHRYPWAKQQRDSLADRLFKTAQKEMKAGRIGAANIELLNTLSKEDTYCDAVILLKAEDIFRSCSFQEYQDFLDNLPDDSNSNIRSILQSRQEQFTQNFLRDLEDITLDFSKDFLQQAYGNMSILTSLTDAQCIILAYICIRQEKNDQFAMLKQQIEQRLGKEKAICLDFFRGVYYNFRMKKVYEQIRKGDIPPKEWLEWTDSLGLSALHYAIILKQEDIINQILDLKSWNTKSPVIAPDIPELFDYTVLACISGVQNRATVFQKTSDLIAAQLRSRKALQQRMWFKERKLDIQNAAVQKAKDNIRLARKNNMPNAVLEYQEKLEVLLGRRYETTQEINEIKQSIFYIDFEIQEITRDALIASANVVYQLRSSTDPFVQYVLHLFSDPHLVFRVLCGTPGECRLYNYHGFFFATLTEIQIELPYFEINSEKRYSRQTENKTNGDSRTTSKTGTKDDPIVKPYGSSWFSPRAHQDIKKLKEEYRTLAKMYHPDICRHTCSTQIFQEILNERAKILEQMEE